MTHTDSVQFEHTAVANLKHFYPFYLSFIRVLEVKYTEEVQIHNKVTKYYKTEATD